MPGSAPKYALEAYGRTGVVLVGLAWIVGGCARADRRIELEVCDGLDNDLDGRADEGFGLGEPCGDPELGGTVVCSTPFAVRCSAQTSPSNGGSGGGGSGGASGGASGGEAGGDGEVEGGDDCRVLANWAAAPTDGRLPTACEDRGCDGQDCCAQQVLTCTPDLDGFRFAYRICQKLGGDDGGKPVEGPSWAVCDFAGVYDFSSFDAASRGERGIVEVRFCVEAPVTGAQLQLWYGQHPLRKALRLKAAGERLETGCYVRHFDAAAAEVPTWCAIPESCLREAEACPTRSCLEDFATKATEWSSSPEAIDPACGSVDSAPYYDLSTTRLTLAAEGCDFAEGEVSGVVRIDSVKLVSRSCACSEEKPCNAASDRPRCYAGAASRCSDDDRLGVCGPRDIGCIGPPGPGVDCTVEVDGATYQGKTRCEQGGYVCTLD